MVRVVLILKNLQVSWQRRFLLETLRKNSEKLSGCMMMTKVVPSAMITWNKLQRT